MYITLNCNNGQYQINEYSIAGNFDDGYTIWETNKGEDSDTLYENISFEKCIWWCINNQNKTIMKDKIKEIVDYMVTVGCDLTTTGNFIFEFEEIEEEFNIKLNKDLIAEIASYAYQHYEDKIIEIETENCFDFIFYLNSCPHYEDIEELF